MYFQTHLLFGVRFPVKLPIDQFILLRNSILISTDSQESQFYILLPQTLNQMPVIFVFME